MLEYKYEFTKEEIAEVVKTMSLIMDFVRILTADEIYAENAADTNKQKCYCYKYLNRSKPCEVCISKMALDNKKDATKLEFINGNCYQFFSRYIIVDGKESVIEAGKKISERAFIDSDGYRDLVARIAEKNPKVYIDSLTGVYNRTFYEEKEKYNTKAAGIAVLGLDDFKLWNETYEDRVVGDIAIQTVVQTIKNNIRSNDRVIRYGGDEFLLILEGVQRKSFERKLEKIRQQIHAIVIPGCTKMTLSVSIGATMASDEPRDESVAKVYHLMYAAKAYKNRIFKDWEKLDESIVEENIEDDKPLILIVDDSEMNRFLLHNILEDKYHIIEAENGDVAIKMIEQYRNELAIVLLDIVMPKLMAMLCLNI